MKNPKISIIIPVYNGEKYLKRCILSIEKNHFPISEFEIICVNDGSKDSSVDILLKLNHKFKNIKIVDQKNQGIAATRNKGIKTARGKYLVFIDQDDYIDENYLQTYYQQISDEDCEIVMGAYARIDSQNKVIYKMSPGKGILGSLTIVSPWAKIYLRSFIIDNKIEFLSNSIGEDVYFNLLAVQRGAKIKLISYCGYVWFYNEKSFSNEHHKDSSHISDFINLLKITRQSLKKIPHRNLALEEYFFTRFIYWYLLYSFRNSARQEIIKGASVLIDWLDKNYPNYSSNHYLRALKLNGEKLVIKLILWILILMSKLRLLECFLVILIKSKLLNKLRR